MDLLRQILSEDNGNPSTIRVVAIIVPLVIIGTWSWNCISTGTMIGFEGFDLLALIGAPAAKVMQKSKEA